MCGRYALYGPQSRCREHFHTLDWPDFADRFNIAPTSWVPVVRQAPDGKRLADLLRWGLIPHWAKDPSIGAKLNNARGESLAEKPSFRDAFQRRRCLVPASGFYEWKAEGKAKQPYYIRLKSGDLLAMAGLWESWRGPDGKIIRTFCVITTGPNALMEAIHDRMPVIIRSADFARWLDSMVDGSTGPASLPAPCESDLLEAWPVSKAVSRAENEGKELIEPV